MITNDNTMRLRQEILSRTEQKIRNLHTPDDFADIVVDNILTPHSLIGLDITDVNNLIDKSNLVDIEMCTAPVSELCSKIGDLIAIIMQRNMGHTPCNMLLYLVSDLKEPFTMTDMKEMNDSLMRFDGNIDIVWGVGVKENKQPTATIMIGYAK